MLPGSGVTGEMGGVRGVGIGEAGVGVGIGETKVGVGVGETGVGIGVGETEVGVGVGVTIGASPAISVASALKTPEYFGNAVVTGARRVEGLGVIRFSVDGFN